MKWLLLVVLCTPMLVMAQPGAPSPARLPSQLHDIGITQRLNAAVPLDLPFTDEHGRAVHLRDYFGKRPVVLVPVYYTCPMLCSQILSGVIAGLRPLSLKPGKDFEFVAFSFNPAETPQEALAKQQFYVQDYSPHASSAGWHFLTGSPESIHALTDAIGFHYRYDPATKMFLHASGIMLLTPEGKLSRYFYGVEYEPKDLRLGLVESSEHRISSPVAEVLLFCYHYDPTTGKYGATVLNLLHGAGILTLVLMAIGFTLLFRTDLRRYRAKDPGETH